MNREIKTNFDDIRPKVEYSEEVNDEKKNKTGMALWIVNAIFIFPPILSFTLLWWLFGGLSGVDTQYYLVLGGLIIYIVISIWGLLKSIYNAIKENRTHVKIFWIILGSIIALILISVVVTQTRINTRREQINSTYQYELGK